MALSTIQQTMSAEAASALSRSVAEAARRKHAHTTPLHVVSALLAEPSGLLRRACTSSHSGTAHPLHCRALELCFSVALDRLPSSDRGPAAEPPVSNALRAALKRAQANQRRGGAEQPPPLLAIKVEVSQLLLSVLDDPSVSRVMHEAGFSSTDVKAAVEQSLSSPSSSSSTVSTASPSAVSPALFSTTRVGALDLNSSARTVSASNIYMNPRLQQRSNGSSVAAGYGGENPRTEELKRVMDILLRSNKRNPVLVGDMDPGSVMAEAIKVIESGAAVPPLKTAIVISLEEELAAAAATNDTAFIIARSRELGGLLESEVTGGRGVVLNLGDLKWLVESPNRTPTSSPVTRPQQIVGEAARAAVAEIGRLLKRFEGSGGVWVVGTATCTAYLRCQVYHPTLEKDWDLQAVQMAPRSPILPRLPVNGGATAPRAQLSEIMNFSRSTNLFPGSCTKSYTHKLAMEAHEKSSSKVEGNSVLPPWLQLAKLSNEGSRKPSSDQAQIEKDAVLKKWRDTSSRLHSKSPPRPLSMTSPRPPPERKLTISDLPITLENTALNSSLRRPVSPPAQAVKSDLVLESFGASKSPSVNCLKSQDTEIFKRLFNGILSKVSWQQEAASATATVVMECKSETRKRPCGGAKSDTWLLFLGPDKIGKRKMAAALAEITFAASPVTISLSGAWHATADSRGRTLMDRVADTVRRNPFSVVLLEDIDQADVVVTRSIKRAVEQGRLLDSNGREVSLGSVIFVLTSTWMPEELRRASDQLIRYEEKILRSAAHQGWQLELSAERNPGKRCADWLRGGDQTSKIRKQSSCAKGLSLDLNLEAAAEEEEEESSSDVTVEHEDSRRQLATRCSTSTPTSFPSELMELVDVAVMFKPVDLAPLRRCASESISKENAAVMGGGCYSIKVDEEVVEWAVGAAWVGGETVDEWSQKVLRPCLKQSMGDRLEPDAGAVVLRLSAVRGGGVREEGRQDLQPATATVR